MEDTVVVEFTRENEKLGILMVTERTFSTGSRGFFGSSKLTIDGKKYQCQVQMVEIGSRPKPVGYVGPEEAK
jgi:hypothetical protein